MTERSEVTREKYVGHVTSVASRKRVRFLNKNRPCQLRAIVVKVPTGGKGKRMVAQQLGWADQAACRGSESVLFYSPDTLETKDARQRRERHAKQLCTECPVRDDCLETALSQRESYGIWGGLTELERRAYLRR